jgi:hypothetical protein
MRTFSFVVAITALSWLATSASAQRYRDTSGDAINPGKAINESATNTDIQLGVEQGITQGTYQTPGGVPNQQGNHWRYRFQNSQWWYYQPNNQWVVWNGRSWVPPAGATVQTNQPQQHQSGFRGTQGMNAQAAPQTMPAPQQPAQAAQPQRSVRSAAPITAGPQAPTAPQGATPTQPKGPGSAQ